MTQPHILFVLAVALLVSALSCRTENPTPTYSPPDSSYGLIYSQILQTTCAVPLCHDGSGDGPILTGSGTYSLLLSAQVNNLKARQANLSYIKPFSPDSSFLYQKIDFDSSSFQFGAPMPQGGLSLNPDQIAFVQEWIQAGAPELGHVANRSLIE